VRSWCMPRKPEAADAITKKIGEVMRERTSDVLSEELPEDMKRLLDRLRQDAAKRPGR
jgi:hypothetical protein